MWSVFSHSRNENRPGITQTARITSFMYVVLTMTSAQWYRCSDEGVSRERDRPVMENVPGCASSLASKESPNDISPTCNLSISFSPILFKIIAYP